MEDTNDNDNNVNVMDNDFGRVAVRRIKRGECPTCGMRLFKPAGILGKRKAPLNIPGRVLEGRCLICYPSEDEDTLASEGLHVPSVLTVDDDSTVVSAITVEHSFARPGETDFDCQSIDENAELPPPLQLSRPGPSGFGDLAADKDHRPKMPTRRRLPDASAPPAPPQRHGSGLAPRSRAVRSTATMPSMNMPSKPPLPHRPRLKFPAPAVAEADEPPQTMMADEEHYYKQQTQGAFSQIPEPIRDHSTHSDSSEVKIVLKKTFRSRRNRRKEEVSEHSSQDVPLETAREDDNSEGSGFAYHEDSAFAPRHALDELRGFLRQLESNRTDRLSLLNSIAICIWDWGGPAKDIFGQENGVEALATLLWTDMTNTQLVQETARLILALAAADDHDRPVLTQTTATEGLMDAFLISLHTLIHDPKLQEIACRIFCCLAAASSRQIHDGTLSGALQSVLNAMDAHQDCQEIQEWGVRALYNQCVCSANAEPNKRSLVSATLDSGATGRDVLTRILQNYPATGRPVECCAQLYWLLSASADLAEMLSPAATAQREMLRLLRDLHEREGVSQLQEALLGTLANLTALEQNQEDPTFANDLMLFVLKTIDKHKTQFDILHESCCLLSALVTNQGESQAASDGVRILLKILKTPSFRKPDASALLEAVLRALVALSVGSLEAKEALLSDPYSLMSVLKMYRSLLEAASPSDNGPEICCNLMASLFAAGDEKLHPRRRAIQTDAVEYVCECMSRFLDAERLQDAACRALRNFSCFPECSELIFRNGAVKFLIDGMKNFADASGLHSNACCTLWNMKLHVGGAILTGDDVQCIVTSLQNHLEDQTIVLMACGALWSNVCGSEDLKRHLVAADGGVDAIACVLVMHPDKEAVVQTACGLLTCLTVTTELVEGVVSTEGFQNMCDIMRGGNLAVPVLKAGALFMRNVCLAFPEFANEASSVIPSMLIAMKNNTGDASFQKEACSFLWLVAAQSADTKSKILALDGVALLMTIVESYSGVEGKVEEVALGAFRELALSTTAF